MRLGEGRKGWQGRLIMLSGRIGGGNLKSVVVSPPASAAPNGSGARKPAAGVAPSSGGASTGMQALNELQQRLVGLLDHAACVGPRGMKAYVDIMSEQARRGVRLPL